MLRELESRIGVPGAFIESDLVEPRYFSPANVKNRIESAALHAVDQQSVGVVLADVALEQRHARRQAEIG